MNSQEFEELLNKADKLGVETYLEAILSNALKSMAEFLNIGEIKKSKISLAAVEMFLEEKELISHLQKINESFGKDENTKIEISDILKVMKNVMIVREEPLPEIQEEEKFETEEIKAIKPKVIEVEEDVDSEGEVEQEQEEVQEQEQEKEEDQEQEQEKEEDQEQEQDQEKEQEQNQEEDQEQEQEQGEDQEPDQEEIETIVEQIDKVEEKLLKEDLDEKEIVLPQSAKLRIRMDENIRIEPIYEELTYKAEESVIEESEEDLKLIDNSTADEDNADELNESEELSEEGFLEEVEKSEEINEEPDHLSLILKQQDNNQAEIKNEEDLIYKENIVENDDIIEIEEKFDDVEKVNVLARSTQENSDEPIKVDLAEILEHKEMTKIIEVIYDYDIEDFAKSLDEISNCKNAEDAHVVINQMLLTRRISRKSKEAETFRTIISEYFGGK